MSRVAIITTRIDYNSCYFLIVPDIAAGSIKKYTVYKIPTSSGQRVKIIGRELTLGNCKRLVKKYL